MFTEKEKGIVLLALMNMANNYYMEWTNGKEDHYREGVLSALKVARKIDNTSIYTYDIGALAAKMK